MQKTKMDSTLSIWKFAAALFIMGHHSVSFYSNGNYPFHGGYIYTEFFFLISGYFCMRFLSEKLNNNATAVAEDTKLSMNYVWGKFKKIFPYTTVAFLMQYLLDCILKTESWKAVLKLIWKLPLEITYLSNLQILGSRMGQLWYVGVMFVALPVICYLFVNHKRFFYCVFLWLFPLEWYAYIYQTYQRIGNRGQFIDLGRGMANLLLGCLVYVLAQQLKNKNFRATWQKVIFTIAAWGTWLMTVGATYKYYGTVYDFVIILLLMCSLILLFSGVIFSFQSKIINFLGELSTPIYIVHITIRTFLSENFGGMGTVKSMILYYAGTFVYALILYFVVKAGLKLFRRKLSKNV